MGNKESCLNTTNKTSRKISPVRKNLQVHLVETKSAKPEMTFHKVQSEFPLPDMHETDKSVTVFQDDYQGLDNSDAIVQTCADNYSLDKSGKKLHADYSGLESHVKMVNNGHARFNFSAAKQEEDCAILLTSLTVVSSSLDSSVGLIHQTSQLEIQSDPLCLGISKK